MAGEIRRRIEALEKMMGRSAEYDKGLLEGIDALEEVEKELDWKTGRPNSGSWCVGIFEDKKGFKIPAPMVCQKLEVVTNETTEECWKIEGFTNERNPDCEYYRGLKCICWHEIPERRKDGRKF